MQWIGIPSLSAGCYCKILFDLDKPNCIAISLPYHFIGLALLIVVLALVVVCLKTKTKFYTAWSALFVLAMGFGVLMARVPYNMGCSSGVLLCISLT
jgi:hypothetical protein